MTRHSSIKSIYTQSVLENLIISLADDFTDEERAQLLKQLQEQEEEQARLKQEQTELMEEPEEIEPEEEVEREVEPEEAPESAEPEEPETPEEPEEEIPEDEKVEMPGQLEKGQQFEWVETEAGMGMLKKYSPSAVIAKECPVCTFQNRPIYETKCQNCKQIFKRMRKFIAMKKRHNKEYTPEMAFEELAPRYKYIGARALREIYETKGETDLPEVNEIRATPRKQLEDILWYRLNVKRDPKTGEPILDKRGQPVPLETKDRKYFSTEEMTEAMHISPETLRAMVADYNSKIIANLPESAKALIKTDEQGEILPSTARQLEPYGYVAPAVIMGTGMADVRRRITHEQEEKLSPEQVEGIKGPAFKSVDIAAWNWDKLAPVFGWDEKAGKFTHGWMKFLREKFLPAVRKSKFEQKVGALQRVIDMYTRIAASQREDVQSMWHDKKNRGLRVHTYFHYNPNLDVEEFKREWQDEYDAYKKEHQKVVEKAKIDKALQERGMGDVLQILQNYDKRKEPLDTEARQSFIEGLASKLKISPEQMEEHLELRDEANEIISDRPSEIEYMMFLDANPHMTRKDLKKKYDRRRKMFEKFVWAKKEAAAEQFEAKAERLKEKVEELKAEFDDTELPEDFNLAEEVHKFHRQEEQDSTPRDADPEVDKDIREEEAKLAKEKPLPTPPQPDEVLTEKKSSRLEQIISLATGGQLDLFAPPEEEVEEDEEPQIKPPTMPGTEGWGPSVFSQKPNVRYIKEVAWLDNLTNKVEKLKGSFLWQGAKSFEEELTNAIGNYGFHNFGARPGDILVVTLTDPYGARQTYNFELDESGSGPVTFKGKSEGALPTPKVQEPEEDEEELPEPELDQEEKAENAPVEDFGKVKGKYFVYFEWNPDTPDQPNSYKSFFAHTPGRRNVEFEDLLKAKIEKRFSSKILQLMPRTVDPEHPERNLKKYVHVTVIEPTTERRRRFGAVFNRETGDLVWHGTGGMVERKERERRLNLEKNKELKKELNLGLIKSEDIELVGDDDLKLVEKKEEDVSKPKKRYTGMSEKDRQRAKEIREQRKKKLEEMTPEEKAQLEEEEEERKTKWTPAPKEFTEPSGKPDPAAPVRKVVVHHDVIQKMMDRPVIDPITDQPQRDAKGEVIKERKLVKIPKTDSFLVTIRLDSEGNPAAARCEKIGLSFRETGEILEQKRRTYPKVYDIVRKWVDSKRPNLRKEKRWDERKDIIDKEYEKAVVTLKGEGTEAFTAMRKKEPWMASESENISTKPYPGCPPVAKPFKKVCPEIRQALNSLEGKPPTGKYEVYDWDDIKRKAPRETPKEQQERRRRHDVTDFFADDRTASRLEQIIKLNTM